MEQRQLFISQLCCHPQVRAGQPRRSAPAVHRLEIHQQQHWPPRRGTSHKRHGSRSEGKRTLLIAAATPASRTNVWGLLVLLQKITSSLKIQKAEVHALYRCMAHNKVGEDSRVIFFHVTRKTCIILPPFPPIAASPHYVSPCDVGGLEVSVSPSGEPLEEDHVVLRCKADKLIYEDLAWFRVANVTEAEQLSSVQPCRSLVLQETHLIQRLHSNLDSANVTLELPMPNASRKDEGLYACQVKNIKTQEKTCLLRRLSLKSKKNLSCYFMNTAALSELNQFSWDQKSKNRSKTQLEVCCYILKVALNGAQEMC